MNVIGIVGGGVMGLCAGLELLEAGNHVVIVDDDRVAQAASWGNAGHIAVEQVDPIASIETIRTMPKRLFPRGPVALPVSSWPAWLPFGLRLMAAARPSRFRAGRAALGPLLEHAMPAWAGMVERIGEPDLLRQDGHFVAWHGHDAASAGRAAWDQARTGTAQVHGVTEEERDMLSALANRRVAGAIRFSGSGQIADLGALRTALRKAFVSRGGTVREACADLNVMHGRAQIAGLEADQVLVCAGVRSRALMEAVGHKVPMIAERGYHVRGDSSGWPERLPPVVFEERSMIVTSYGSTVQAASFVEFSRLDAPADPRKWERLERHISELGLPISGPFRRWMGCRPTLPDYLPAIGRSTRATNLYYAFGHQHLGLTLAPITARLVNSMVAGGQSQMPLAPFDIERFAGRNVL